jgi:hypothetical protein
MVEKTFQQITWDQADLFKWIFGGPAFKEIAGSLVLHLFINSVCVDPALAQAWQTGLDRKWRLRCLNFTLPLLLIRRRPITWEIVSKFTAIMKMLKVTGSDWLSGTVVQVDPKMIAVQFQENVYLTDGWMVPDHVLWYPKTSSNIRPALGRKRKRSRTRAK